MAVFPASLLEGNGSLTDRIAGGMRKAIRSGTLRAGERAPSTRRLAIILGVSRNVIAAAYDELAAEGLLTVRSGSGTFIAGSIRHRRDAAPATAGPTLARATPAPIASYGKRAAALALKRERALPPPGGIALHYWQTASDPRAEREWARLAKARRARSHAADPDPIGAASLRDAIARRIVSRRGIDATASDIIIVNEAQQGLDLAARILIDPGDSVLMEEPHYDAARHLFLAAGASIALTPLDDEGANLAASAARAKLAYLTPSHQFPTGVRMSAARRAETLNWCAHKDVWLVEDDFNSEYQYNAARLDAIKAGDSEGRIIYLATLARSISPSVRLGFMVVPPALREAFASAKCVMDRGAFAFDQDVLAAFIETGGYERHLLRMGRLYEAKRKRIREALAHCFANAAEMTTEAPGLHVFVRFPNLGANQCAALVATARGCGVTIDDAGPYYLGPPQCAAVLLGFGATPLDQIEEGARRLMQAYRRVQAGTNGAKGA